MSSDKNDYDDLLDESFDYEEEDYDEIDFGDDDGFDDDFDSLEGEDEFADLEMVEGAGADTTSEKKKFELDFNTIVIIGAVIVGGIIMMSQISSKKPAPKAPSQEKFASALQMQGTFDGPGAVNAIEKKVDLQQDADDDGSQGGFLFDADSLDVDVSEQAVPPMPTSESVEPLQAEQSTIIETKPDLDVIKQVAVPLANNVVPDVDVNPEKIILPTEDKVVLRAPEEDITANEFLQDSTVQQSMNVQEVEAVEAIDLVIEEPVTISSYEDDIPLVEAEVISSSVSSNESQDVNELLSRIDSMEREMRGTKEAYERTIRGLESKLSSLKQSGTNSASSTKAKPKSSRKKTVTNRTAWELRAAQPGRAWVSKKGQKEMRPLVVGDKLPGLGRIRDISYQNQRWVVIGSEGKIMQ